MGTLTVVLMLFSLAQDRWQKTLSPLVGLGKQEIAHILVDFLRGNTLTEWPGTIVTISYFMIEGPCKEHGTNKPPPTRLGKVKRRCQFGKGQKEMPRVLLPPRILLVGIHPG